MPGQRPKVVYEVNGEPMVRWVVRAVRESGARPIVLVVGYGAEQVRAVFDGDDADLVYAVQDRQLGTGHATLAAAGALRGFAGEVIALAGDGPLIRGATIRSLLQRHRGAGAAATLAAAVVDDPAGYGRIVRDSQGHFRAIVEDRNATDAQRAIREIYPSYAVFDAGLLFEALRRLAPDEASGEYRITDVPAMLLAEGHRVELLDGFPPEEVLSINTPAQLREVDRILSSRVEACHERG
jgi:bifunctional N-acetylglucosamine-1-phosphate-uridyltransferase/glucosamine-1-phosphate-acetyltransferase GlmU-like protein